MTRRPVYLVATLLFLAPALGQSPAQTLEGLQRSTPPEVHDYYAYAVTHDIAALARVLDKHGLKSEAEVITRPLPKAYLIGLHVAAFRKAIAEHPAGDIKAPDGQLIVSDRLHEEHLDSLSRLADELADDGSADSELRRRNLTREELDAVRTVLLRLKDDLVPESLPGAKIRGIASLDEGVEKSEFTAKAMANDRYASPRQLAAYRDSAPRFVSLSKQGRAAAEHLQAEVAKIERLLRPDEPEAKNEPPGPPAGRPDAFDSLADLVDAVNVMSEAGIRWLNAVPLLPDYVPRGSGGGYDADADVRFMTDVLFELGMEAVGIRAFDAVRGLGPRLPFLNDLVHYFDEIRHGERGSIEVPGRPRVPPKATLGADDLVKGMEIDPTKAEIFRGGDSLVVTPKHVKIDKPTGLVRPTHGLSLESNLADAAAHGPPFEIKSIPPELKIIQRGDRLAHFEIVPREAMTIERFQELLDQVILAPRAD